MGREARPEEMGGVLDNWRQKFLGARSSSRRRRITAESNVDEPNTRAGRAAGNVLVHIDTPADGRVTTPYVLLSGWIAVDPSLAVDGVTMEWGGRSVDVDLVARSDVERVYPSKTCVGFQSLSSLEAVADLDGSPQLVLDLDGMRQEFDVPALIDRTTMGTLRAAQERKRQRIQPLLACPQCRSAAVTVAGTDVRCAVCTTEFSTAGHSFDFITTESRARFNVTSTEQISSWGYDERARAIIDRYRDGLILDCGSGLRPEYLDNVVNFEVVDYPTTDVVGVGQALPFQDASFDAVFSFAVLEHVTDPFGCAQEMLRVLKPGGTLFAVVPFLQPFHGYPDHYYNMTSSGLRHLFASGLAIDECTVPQAGLPIFALGWFLNSYLNGLPSSTAADFAEMRVKDLIANPWSYLDQPFVTALSAGAVEELAATNSIIGIKPER